MSAKGSVPGFRAPPSGLIQRLYRTPARLLLGRLILLLTTTGRRTGLPRVTPLQYEEVNGAFYLGSARGTKADWYRNIVMHPCVGVRLGAREFDAVAETVTDPGRIADFLQLRLKRHPRIVGAILASEGLSRSPTRAELEAYAARLALVIVRPALSA